MNDKPNFGFDDFKTKPAPLKTRESELEGERIDEVGELAGFTSRNSSIQRRRKKGVTKPTDQFNIRAHIEDINSFIGISEETGQSYRQLFAELIQLKRAKK